MFITLPLTIFSRGVGYAHMQIVAFNLYLGCTPKDFLSFSIALAQKLFDVFNTL